MVVSELVYVTGSDELLVAAASKSISPIFLFAIALNIIDWLRFTVSNKVSVTIPKALAALMIKGNTPVLLSLPEITPLQLLTLKLSVRPVALNEEALLDAATV